MRNVLKKTLWALLLAVLLLGVPRVSGLVASMFDYQGIDPDGAYAWISVHHIVQAFIFLCLMSIINRIKPQDFGFGWGDKKAGLRYVRSFTIIFTIGSAVSHLLIILLNAFQPFAYPLSATNIIGQLGFQLLLSGPSEELIFRAFAITLLGLAMKKRVAAGKVSLANLIAAVIFGLAHVRFAFMPFSVQFSTFQVILSIVLGLFYGDCYEKTRSMYYPMLMHSISNVVMVSFSIIATAVLPR